MKTSIMYTYKVYIQAQEKIRKRKAKHKSNNTEHYISEFFQKLYEYNRIEKKY